MGEHVSEEVSACVFVRARVCPNPELWIRSVTFSNHSDKNVDDLKIPSG